MPSWNGHFRSATDPKFGVRISCTAVYTGRFSGIFVKTVHKKLSCRGPRRGSFRDALLEWAFSRCDGPQIRGANLLLGWVVRVSGWGGWLGWVVWVGG